MSKMDAAAAALAIFTDATRAVPERIAGFEEADRIRRELKTGWAKLGVPDAAQTFSDLKAANDQFDVAEGPERTKRVNEEAIRAVLEAGPGSTADHIADHTGLEPHDIVGLLDGMGDVLAVEADGVWTYSLIAEDPAEAATAPGSVKPKRPKKEPKPIDPNRGALTRLVEELLMDAGLGYDDILALVVKAHPAARTTRRSLASVAADMRKERRIDVPVRRRVAAPKEA
jgi:hypothetical protein